MWVFGPVVVCVGLGVCACVCGLLEIGATVIRAAPLLAREDKNVCVCVLERECVCFLDIIHSRTHTHTHSLYDTLSLKHTLPETRTL